MKITGGKLENYEGLFIITPNIKEEDVKNVYKVISDNVTKNSGSIKKGSPGIARAARR